MDLKRIVASVTCHTMAMEVVEIDWTSTMTGAAEGTRARREAEPSANLAELGPCLLSWLEYTATSRN